MPVKWNEKYNAKTVLLIENEKRNNSNSIENDLHFIFMSFSALIDAIKIEIPRKSIC